MIPLNLSHRNTNAQQNPLSIQTTSNTMPIMITFGIVATLIAIFGVAIAWMQYQRHKRDATEAPTELESVMDTLSASPSREPGEGEGESITANDDASVAESAA